MSILTKLRNRMARTLATAPMRQTKKVLTMWPAYLADNTQWRITDWTNYIEEGYNVNAIIYAAITYKARASQAAALRAYGGTVEQSEPLPSDHPLSRLLDRPNPFQSMVELRAEAQVFFNLFGNAYVYFKRKRGNDYPESFRNLRPDFVHHLYDKRELKGYLYVPRGQTYRDGTPLLPQDVMHVRLPNPGDPYAGMGKGLSPFSPMAQSGDVDNALTSYLKQFIDYGAMPPGLLSYDWELTDDDLAAARERWMEIYGGSHNWTEVAVLDKSGSYERVGATLDELASEKLDARNENRIAMVFGVPLPLIETNPQIVQSTYSNLDTYERFFWENTLLPELRWFEIEWRYFLRGEDGSFPAYDYSAVGVLQRQGMERAKLILDAAKAGHTTRADVRAALGLDFDPALDNVYVIPLTLQSIPAAPAPRQDDVGGAEAVQDEEQREDEPETDGAKRINALGLSREAKTQFYKAFERTAMAYQGPATVAARKAFEQDKRAILAIVNDAKSAAYSEAKAVSWMETFFDVGRYISTTSKENWRSIFAPIFQAIVTAQGERLEATFGLAFDVRALLAEEFVSSYQFTFVDPISQNSADEIRQIFEAAFADGWSVPQMQETLTNLFEQWMENEGVSEGDLYFAERRLPPYRAQLIARTEMIRASNAGSMGVYRQWAVRMKEWLATMDERVRDSHAAANGQVVPMDEPFEVGGAALMYPGDPNGPLGETVQCRCTVLPVMT